MCKSNSLTEDILKCYCDDSYCIYFVFDKFNKDEAIRPRGLDEFRVTATMIAAEPLSSHHLSP